MVADMPAMTGSQLLADVGGLLGLWLGASILTLLEILEMLGNISLWLIKKIEAWKCRCRKNTVGGQFFSDADSFIFDIQLQ